MDGDRKKRKIDTEPVVQEEESEEEKMEKFFALIRNTREARDRLRGSGLLLSTEESEKSREDRRKAEEDQHRRRESAWNPTFQPQDFSQDPILYKSSTTASTPDVPSSSGHEDQSGPSESKQDDDDKKKTEKDGDGRGDDDGSGGGGLNLKLSL